MKQIKVNKISVDIVWEMIWKAWELSRVNYPLVMGIVVLLFVGILLGAIPFLGPVISAAVASLAPFIFMHLCSQLEKGHPSSFNESLSVFQNKERFQVLLPLVAINFVLSGAPAMFQNIPGLSAFGSLVSFLTIPVTVILNLTFPILFFNYKELQLIKALSLSVEGLALNIVPFVVGAVLIMALVIFSVILLVLPFIFVTIPVLIGYNYLWYRVVYEDLILEVKDEGII